MLKPLWECPKCHEHFYQYVIDRGTPVCGVRNKDCPAKLAASSVTRPKHLSGGDQ